VLSAIFVDRPRLAIVIAIVITIAGGLALYVIPFAQYPDIVPPQVTVTTLYPGANSAVVDGTVAQPIEAQLVGVDKMMYMKSVSGDDGSYRLAISFELGTDPDINAVNVNNRVQIALSSLPQEVQRQGVTVKKQSSALLGAVAFYSPKHSHDPLFLSNYVTINLLDRIKSTPGVGEAMLWGPQDYAMRAWIRTDRLTGLGLTVGDIISAIQSQNAQAAVGRIGARPISDDQQLQLNIQTKGRLASVAEFEKSSSAQIRTGRRSASATWRASNWAQPISIAIPGLTAGRQPLWRSFKRREQTRSRRSGPYAPASRSWPNVFQRI
jgi:multidrug efflux pump subunit AcrB